MAQITAVLIAVVAIVAQARPAPQPAPILENVDLMDIVVKPAYDDLQQAMATPPADRQAWAAIYQKAARLAEIENLLFLRTRAATERRGEWAERAAQARQASADVAAAALTGLRATRPDDFDLVRRMFTAVSAGCNASHRTFSREAPAIRP